MRPPFSITPAAERGYKGVCWNHEKERSNELVAPTTPRNRDGVVWFHGGRQSDRTGCAEVINIICCLDPAEEVLISNLTESNVGLVGGSVFHLGRSHKHTGTSVMASDHQDVEWLIRNTVDNICACRECLSTDHKRERQCYIKNGLRFRIGSHTQPKQECDCD